MQKSLILKFVTGLFFTFIFHSTLIAQKATEEKILGCWKIKSIEFLEINKDSMNLINSTKGIITCFEKDAKFTTKLKSGTDVQIVGTGTYSISADGKTFNQKRDADDGAVDEPAEIVKFNDKEVSFKISKMILHFERLSKQ
ncbi:MAG: hypothetical protein QM737_22910 [Ferruginibacter sp.]